MLINVVSRVRLIVDNIIEIRSLNYCYRIASELALTTSSDRYQFKDTLGNKTFDSILHVIPTQNIRLERQGHI